jgi:hypothetical protein
MKKNVILAIGTICLAMCLATPLFGQSSDFELRRRIEQLEKRLGLYQQKEKENEEPRWTDHINLNGTVEFDYEYADDSDVSDNTVNDSTSDIKVGTVELGLGIEFHETVTGSLVLKAENVGDSDSTTSDDVFVDEAIITLQKEGFPLYFLGGKRTQPFGYFNSNLANDPITQDLYEISKAGATVGWTPGVLNMDISLTVYRGETLADKAEEAGIGFTRDKTSGYTASNDVSSYIANITAYCLNDCMSFAGYFNSEPGDGDRNETIGGTFHYSIENIKLDLDAEYMAAMSRENASNDEEAKESAWFVAAAYQVIDPLQLAIRYEAFDDDVSGDQAGTLEDRFSLGGTYKLFEKEPFVCNLMAEYRLSNYEDAAGADDNLNEFFARLCIAF